MASPLPPDDCIDASMADIPLCCAVDSVTDLQPNDTAEDPFFYMFRVQCTGCRETHPNWVSISRFVRFLCPTSLPPTQHAAGRLLNSSLRALGSHEAFLHR